jgi:hypothetical protein
MAFWNIYHGSLVYFMALWYILWPFGIFCGPLVYFMALWYTLWPFGIFNGPWYTYFMAFWYIYWHFGIFIGTLVYFAPFLVECQEKSGNPGHEPTFNGSSQSV